MNIGITYDLRSEYLAAGYGEEETAEFDREETIEAIDEALLQLGHQVERIGNARQLVQSLAAGKRWDLVFNICEGLSGYAREAQVPAILDVYEIPYTFADPLTMALCLHKSYTKTVVERAGVPTPRYVLVEDLQDVDQVDFSYPVFAKPVAEGTGKGVTPASRVDSQDELRSVCRSLLERYAQPVLVEEYLPGREFTVGLLGSGEEATVLGTLEIVLLQGAEPNVYSYVNKEKCEELVQYVLVRAEDDPEVARAETISLAAWQALGGRDGGRIDLRSNRFQQPQFMEANPLAGMHPSHSDLPMLATARQMPYIELIDRIVRSAEARLNTQRPQLARTC